MIDQSSQISVFELGQLIRLRKIKIWSVNQIKLESGYDCQSAWVARTDRILISY
jgi:hypothetical protein